MDSDLELHSTQELVDELLRRNTFLGVIIHSVDEWRGKDWGAERTFRVEFNQNLTRPMTTRLLEVISDSIQPFDR